MGLMPLAIMWVHSHNPDFAATTCPQPFDLQLLNLPVEYVWLPPLAAATKQRQDHRARIFCDTQSLLPNDQASSVKLGLVTGDRKSPCMGWPHIQGNL